MKKDKTLELIRQQFTDARPVGPDLVRAERRHNQSAIGVFFFDLSESLANPKFELSDYLQNNIATDYYNHEGSLQWNYYLYFVLRKPIFQELCERGTVAKIESDRTFARKFVRDDGLFQQELSKPLALAISHTGKTKDIAAAWTSALSRSGLAAIADPKAAYTRIVERFLAAKPSEEPARTSILHGKEKVASIEPGKFIRQMQLEVFRPFPSLRRFNFGIVNLIRGTNGSGKTTLLEAIELSICGGIRRQDGGRPQAARIGIKFEGDDKMQICPLKTLPPYRLRDLSWYGGYYRAGNELCYNFGRFNFFDTDAAFRLSQANTSHDVQKAIHALFLGDLANTLEERMRACTERFEKEERDFTKRLQLVDAEIRKLNADVKALSDIRDTRKSLLGDLAQHAATVGWKKLPSDLSKEEVSNLEGSVEDLSSRMRDFHTQLRWMPRVTISSLEQEAAKLRLDGKNLASRLRQSEEIQAEIDKLKKEWKSLSLKLDLLRKLISFHDEPDGFSLRGLGKSIEESQSRAKALQEAVRLFRDIDLAPFATSASKLQELQTEHNRQFKRKEQIALEKRKLLSEMQRRVGETRALFAQIKTLGKQFCDLNPHANVCPLCETEFANDELIRRLKKALSSSDDAQLRELSDQVREAEAALKISERIIADLNAFRGAANLMLSKSHVESMTAEAIARRLGALPESLLDEREKTTRLIQMQTRMEKRGFTERALKELIDEAKAVLELPVSTFEDASTVRHAYSEKEDLSARLTQSIRQAEKKQKGAEAEFQTALKSALGKTNIEEPLVELERRLELVNETLSTTGEQKAFSPPPDEDLLSVTNRLRAFGEFLVRLEAALKRVEEKDALERRALSSLEDATKRHEKCTATLARAKEALKVLNQLLQVENKAAYLQEIVRQHQEKLVAIFTRIHAPNDFADVRFNGDILLRRHDGSDAKIAEISTGQRAALSLSIFLSLNSSVSDRAPWLIFDDPVVHVDDLNTLSFFDSLRDLVLLGNRQVFFATANARVANLFTRKFDFLCEEFKDFPLERLPAAAQDAKGQTSPAADIR